MSSVSDWAILAEDAIAFELGVDLVPDTIASWYDAETPDGLVLEDDIDVVLRSGTKFEFKLAAYRQQDAASTRRGRYWIRQANHERLLEAGGWYVLGVYDVDAARDATRRDDLDAALDALTDLALTPATAVDDQLETWTPTPSGDSEAAARAPWSRFFPTQDVSDNRPTADTSKSGAITRI